jgi:putative transposase
MDWARILAYVTGTVDQELLARNEYLATENRILKVQLSGRLKLSDAERGVLGEIGHRVGRKVLADVATVARPDTILGWYRKLVARKFDGSQARRGPGRPRIKREVEQLIIRMASENRDWGYDRIAGALANLGYEISDQTVGNVCNATVCRRRRSASARLRGPPSFEPTWRCWRGPTSSPQKC